jgi:hypothetical protein
MPHLEGLVRQERRTWTGLHRPARSRYNPAMETTTLSEAALSLLRRRMGGERVPVTDDTRPAYRELVEAGMMIPLHTFFGGDESAYRPTDAACAWQAVNGNSLSSRIPSNGGSPSPGR